MAFFGFSESCFVLLVGGSLGLDLLMVIPSIEAASSLEGAITPGFSSPPVSFWVLVLGRDLNPRPIPSGEAPPTDVSVFGARPKPQVGSLEL